MYKQPRADLLLRNRLSKVRIDHRSKSKCQGGVEQLNKDHDTIHYRGWCLQIDLEPCIKDQKAIIVLADKLRPGFEAIVTSVFLHSLIKYEVDNLK